MNYYEMTQVRDEQIKDWLREAENDRLVRRALKGRGRAGSRFGINSLGWSGLSFLVAGLLFMVVSLVHAPHLTVAAAELSSPGWVLIHVLLMAALLLAFWGLVGLHIYQRERAGRLGLVAFALALCGTVLLAGSLFTEAFVLPLIAVGGEGLLGPSGTLFGAKLFTLPVLIAGASFYLGYLLVGLATLRAGRLPRHAGLVLSIGAPLAILLRLLAPASGIASIGVIAFSLGYMVLGYVLLAGPGRDPLPPTPERA
jgi:hypothetical protein